MKCNEDSAIFFIPGMGGMDRVAQKSFDVIKNHYINSHYFHWVKYKLNIINLRSIRLHNVTARKISRDIKSVQSSSPDKPVVLLAHSTGCMIAVKTLALLKKPISLCILLAPAFSNKVDCRSLEEGANKTFLFSSYRDLAVSLGTLVFGTADGEHSVSVGWNGTADSQFSSVHYVKHDLSWILKYRNFGGHTACLHPHFTSNFIVKLIKSEIG